MINSEHFPIIKYLVQVIFAFGVTGFSMGMLITGKPVEIYLPVITGIIGYMLPNPSLKGRQDQRPMSAVV